MGASPDRHPNPRKSSQDSLRARATPGLAHGPTGHTPRSRWALSLRARLVGAATVAIVLAIALLGGAVSVLLDRELRSALDDTLRQRAVDAARLSVSAPALLTRPGALDASLSGRQLSVQIVDARGRLVARSASLGGRVLEAPALQAAAIGRAADGYEDGDLSGEPVRLYVAPLPGTDGDAAGGAVLVAAGTSEITSTVGELRRLVAISALVAAALGALAAALLTARGMRPLRRLSTAAAAIETTGDPGRRLPEPAAQDEVAELAQTLNRMLAGLERAQATERRFLADASHELRTPLTSLRGNAAYVAEHGADPEVLADIEADAARLSDLLEDLLALEREEAGGPPAESVALADLVAEACRGDDVEAGSVDPVTVRGDRRALERALANLVENARIHGPAGGAITVGVQRDGDRALLWVQDEGPGIAPADAERALTRFWRGADAAERPGTGLGLAIVRATAERHGGQVRIEGARVVVALPAITDLSSSHRTLAPYPPSGARP